MVEKQTYHVEMIRDFLDHLRLEVQLHLEDLRLSRQQTQTDTASVDGALLTELSVRGRKYDAVLLPRIEVSPEGLADAELPAAVAAAHEALLAQRSVQLAQLQALEPLFAEALACAAQPASRGVLRRVLSGRDLLRDRTPAGER